MISLGFQPTDDSRNQGDCMTLFKIELIRINAAPWTIEGFMDSVVQNFLLGLLSFDSLLFDQIRFELFHIA